MLAKLTRTGIGMAAWATVWHPVLPAWAEAPPTTTATASRLMDRRIDVNALRNNRGIERLVTEGTTSSQPAQESGGTGSGTPRRAPVFYVSFPTLAVLPDATRCLRVARRAYPDPVSAAAATDAQDALWRMSVAGFPLCPNARAPETTPAVQAAEFWRVAGEDLLPTPQPRIAPGFMLAGKLAYLEAGSVPTARFEHSTPLGLLTIEATSRLFVDWGDGSGDGPHAGPGGPWPDGTITHFWTVARTYDVTVSQRWTARWRLGDASGQLAGLVTEGRIDDFEVRELQAVRNF